MRLGQVLIFIILILLPICVSAEFYQYRDENGVQRFTDNLADVPINQRENVQPYTDLPSPPGTSLAEELQKTKTELDKEYAELTKERDALESKMAFFSTAKNFKEEEYQAFKERVARFNERRADYEKRVNQLKSNVDTFHAKQAEELMIIENTEIVKVQTPKEPVANTLIKTKNDLDREYLELIKEREAIVAGTDVFSTTEKYEAHKKRVADFNQRSADYMKRAKVFQEKAEAYNKAQRK
jgi:chromosome segregation ATPase